MLEHWLTAIFGLALLVAGGEAIVRGASGIGLLARMSPAVVGLTIVAAGTSMPELVVSLKAAFVDDHGVALGNIVGSNIFNLGVVLGATALVRPLNIRGRTVRFEWPAMVVAVAALHLFARNGSLDRTEGAVLLGGMVAFFVCVVRVARSDTRAGTSEEAAPDSASFGQVGARAWMLNGLAVVIGVGLLTAGADWTVDGASGVAAGLGVPSTVIGLTVVAAGTSTPELVTSLVAAWRGRDDIAVTNVLGSNIFNALGIAGATAAVRPIPVPPEMTARDDWWMLGMSLVLLPLMLSGMRVTRIEGSILALGYVAYLAILRA